jgi:hypothetical protein
LTLANASLAQTGWTGPVLSPDNWRRPLIDRMDQLAWDAVRADVLPFLERPQEADLITRENLMSLLENR